MGQRWTLEVIPRPHLRDDRFLSSPHRQFLTYFGETVPRSKS